ncbi:MAG: acyl-CoA desaturase [Planctomycetes bacterium]|nr:acyl-CoA desaturase [Planctomycetota bacterium]
MSVLAAPPASPDASRDLAGKVAGVDRRVEWRRIAPFVLLHLACALVLVVGWSPVAVGTAVLLYAVRMFGITAFYHRYFSHRAFRAGRVVQFLGAVLGAAATQRGPLWWAAHHRRHHRFADTEQDAHSPHAHGFWWAHMGWFTNRSNFATDLQQVPDLAQFPELVWLDRHDRVVPLLLLAVLAGVGAALAAFAPELGTDAAQMVVWGYVVSTVVLFHATCSINSLGHVFGRRPYATRDQSRNSALLALLTFGEGWHNNHHFCPGSVRQGFHWWQVDVTWYVLWCLGRLGLVSGLRPLPARVRSARRAS